jgi:hypothetical protein
VVSDSHHRSIVLSHGETAAVVELVGGMLDWQARPVLSAVVGPGSDLDSLAAEVFAVDVLDCSIVEVVLLDFE